MKTKLITTRMPTEMEKEIERLAKEGRVQKAALLRELLIRGLQDIKKEQALKLYSEGRITLWKAAELAGISLWEMIDEVKEKKIPVKYSIEDAKDDIKLVLDNI